MNGETAFLHLAAHREAKVTDPRIAKALKAIENDSRLRERLAQQVAFDQGVRELLSALAVPADLNVRLKEVAPVARRTRRGEMVTAIVSVVLGILLILGVLVFFQWQARHEFPGREALVRMVNSANHSTGAELEIISNKAGQLGDWFYMRGFDGYQVPPELKALPAVGSRVFKQDGHAIAQLAIEQHNSLLYICKGDDFGVQLPEENAWCLFETEGWAAAARRSDNLLAVIAFQGTEGEMRAFIDALPKP